jgi:hypothetical protein
MPMNQSEGEETLRISSARVERRQSKSRASAARTSGGSTAMCP